MTSLLLLDNFDPVMHRRVQKRQIATILSCTVRSLVMVRESVASAKGLNSPQRVATFVFARISDSLTRGHFDVRAVCFESDPFVFKSRYLAACVLINLKILITDN